MIINKVKFCLSLLFLQLQPDKDVEDLQCFWAPQQPGHWRSFCPATNHKPGYYMKLPTSDKSGFQRFLGMVNFYQKFIRNTAQILAPLTDALKVRVRVFSGPILWTLPSAELIASPCLCSCSCSSWAWGSDLPGHWCFQVPRWCCSATEASWFLLAFFSMKLSEAEVKYSAFNAENS